MKKNVLLVDDDQVFHFLGTKVLQRMGFTDEIHTANNGKEALKLINNKLSNLKPFIDIIFLDINMPIMDGFSFIEAFRKMAMPHKEKIKIVIVTSSQDTGDIQRAKDLGITDYLIKPISENSIRSVLENH
jgi:CheY-like chemotaxis protein